MHSLLCEEAYKRDVINLLETYVEFMWIGRGGTGGQWEDTRQSTGAFRGQRLFQRAGGLLRHSFLRNWEVVKVYQSPWAAADQ